jgi:hypothetical protein
MAKAPDTDLEMALGMCCTCCDPPAVGYALTHCKGCYFTYKWDSYDGGHDRSLVLCGEHQETVDGLRTLVDRNEAEAKKLRAVPPEVEEKAAALMNDAKSAKRQIELITRYNGRTKDADRTLHLKKRRLQHEIGKLEAIIKARAEAEKSNVIPEFEILTQMD